MPYYVKIFNGRIGGAIDSTSIIDDEDLMEVGETEYKLISACRGHLRVAQSTIRRLILEVKNWETEK